MDSSRGSFCSIRENVFVSVGIFRSTDDSDSAHEHESVDTDSSEEGRTSKKESARRRVHFSQDDQDGAATDESYSLGKQ